MDDPVEELRRQRDLVLAHLRWIDEQIARASPGATPLTPPPPPPGAPASPPQLVSAPRSAATSAPVTLPPDAEIELPAIDPGMIRSEVRKGCFIYIIGVTVLLAASLAAAVWIVRNE